ncbi:auxin efflux carrier component 8-like isoform X1 [Juglans microcarpa x Juglans regia]|uniref:auxin efflux carrier component 8-like isoform X1 n=1 Tax=Juglans microcarpa x Juglans regia TaxID=2249226 RepID=UPI001B7F1E16|nr:auxin efflux carrier component 8-like isoform X1 [Juglans microcarpa x Juglans regia]
MISPADVYHVVEATVPLYVVMIIAYISVKWWKLFTPDQCAGINKFVAKYSIPLLSFQVISTNNPYKMNLKLILADLLQKLLAFLVLIAVTKVSSRGDLNWIITGISLSTLPNTLILGLPLLTAMYGDEAAVLLSQIIVLQSLIWYNLLLFLFELSATKGAAPVTPALEAQVETEIPQQAQTKEEEEVKEEEARIRAARKTKTKTKTMLILLTVGKNFIRNPNTHATSIGLIWASIHYKWGITMPEILKQSIIIISNGGLGMAMFSLGLFMASRVSIIACGTRMAVVAMGMKFLMGPALMAVSSTAVGLRGKVFREAIVQAALPQGIVPFVFAKEYDINPDILSTGVIFGILISMPIALGYYFLLAL